MQAQSSIANPKSKIALYLPLIKSTQTSLLLLTGVAGYLSAHTGVNWSHFLQMLPSLFLAIAGSTILNMWWDQDIDAKMKLVAQVLKRKVYLSTYLPVYL